MEHETQVDIWMTSCGMPIRRFAEFKSLATEHERAIEAVNEFAARSGILWLAFLGKTGTGKTHLACAAAREIYIRSAGKITTRYYKHIRLIREIRSTYDDKRRTEKEVVAEIDSAKLLVLDEVGLKSSMSEWERATLDDIIDHRSEHRKRLIVTSNLPPREFFALLGSRVESRFAEIGRVIAMGGDDYRKGEYPPKGKA